MKEKLEKLKRQHGCLLEIGFYHEQNEIVAEFDDWTEEDGRILLRLCRLGDMSIQNEVRSLCRQLQIETCDH